MAPIDAPPQPNLTVYQTLTGVLGFTPVTLTGDYNYEGAIFGLNNDS